MDLVKEGLNSKGKTSLQVLSTLHELVEAKSANDVWRALANASIETAKRWIAIPSNREWLMKSALKIGRVSPVARNRLVKLIATRLIWAEVALARLAWVTPWLLFLDLLFTPEMTATDEVERRLGFLALYGRIFTRQSSVWSRLVEACDGTEWRFKMPPATALGATIQRMH